MLNASQMYVAAADMAPLLQDNTELVRRIAWRLHRRLPDSVQVEDLIQAGMIGLLEAHERYRPGQEASFATFAGIRIRGAMLDEIRRGDWAPRSLHRAARAAKQAREDIERKHGHAAGTSAVAKKLGLSSKDYRHLCADVAGAQVASLEATLAAQPGLEFAANGEFAPDVMVERQDMCESVARVARQLPEREQLLLDLYYEQGRNLRQIAERLGVSESRACQLHSRAIRRVRDLLGEAA